MIGTHLHSLDGAISTPPLFWLMLPTSLEKPCTRKIAEQVDSWCFTWSESRCTALRPLRHVAPRMSPRGLIADRLAETLLSDGVKGGAYHVPKLSP